ncbi:O-antigen polymerase [Microbacterium sp. A1-JK]|uniref:O-antigen polymerase n=1 Tax=Microbacterium sp. A1-JK TaxID=3177516 RepID=UPI00388776A4
MLASWTARALELITLAIFVLIYVTVDRGISPVVIGINLAVFVLLAVRCVVIPQRVVPWVPTYFTVETLFFIFYYLIFYLPYQEYLLRGTEPAVSRFVLNTFVLGSNEAITLSTIGAICFSFGYRIVVQHSAVMGNPAAAKTRSWFVRTDDYSEVFSVRLGGISALILAALVAIYLGAGWRTEGEGRYTGSTDGGVIAEGISLLILVFSIVSIAVWVFTKSMKWRVPWTMWFGLSIAIIWALRWLTLGDRNSFLLLAIALGGGVFTLWKRASLIVLFASLAGGLLLYNFVEIARMGGDPGAVAASSQSDESSFNITTITLRASVVAVPESYDFAFGTYKMVGLLGVIPLLRGLFVTYFDPPYYTSAELLGDVILGPNAVWNTGSNVISDAYMDFGVPGVIGILLILGIFAGSMARGLNRDPLNPVRAVLYISTLALFAELPRYSADFPVRALAWTALLLLVVHFVTLRQLSHGRRHSERRNLASVRTDRH